MRHDQNPYQAYTEGSIFSDNPLDLVIALYQGALDATHQAESALGAGDIPGRSKAINKTISILTELLVSLDLEKGGEVAFNLKRLYSYMQQQLLNAHIRQAVEPVIEVRKLLTTLLEGWREASRTESTVQASALRSIEMSASKQSAAAAYSGAPVYGGYGDEATSSYAGTAYSF